MNQRAKALFARGVETALTRRGYAGPDLEVARAAVRDWGRIRANTTSARRGAVGGLSVVVTRPGQVGLVPVEVPLAGPAEVTVEVLVSAISPGTERAQWLRLPNARPDLPFRPGYSCSGRILAVGAGVQDFKVDDLVAVSRTPHASVATVPAASAVRVPEGVALEQAALIYLAVIAGYGVRRAAISSGEAVCVLGAGPVGLLAQRLATAAGAGPMTVVASSRRNEAAVHAGACFCLAAEAADVRAPVVIEATGDPDAMSAAIRMAAEGGRVVVLGSPRGVSRDIPLFYVQQSGLTVIGAHISALAKAAKRSGGDPLGDLGRDFLDAVARRVLAVDDLAGDPFDPREIALLYRGLGHGKVHGAHLDWRLLPYGERLWRRRLASPPFLAPTTATVPAPTPRAARPASGSLRFSVIGCGDIGFRNARAVARAVNAELTLVQDLVPELAAAAVAAHGGSMVGTVEEALDPRRVDAVLLSVPHHMHAPLIRLAASAGLHIIVEKPLAHDLQSAQMAADAAAASGVVLSVCFPYRYETATEAARQLVRAGALGPFRGASIVFHADKPPSYWLGGFSGRATSDWRSDRARAGGGVLIMNVTHHLDLLRYITGCEVQEVSAMTRSNPGQDVEDAVALSVRFAGGAVGSVLASASTRGSPESRFEMWGDAGTVQLEPRARVLTERALPGVTPGRWNELPVAPAVDERTIFVERFCSAVMTGDEPDVTAADGVAVQAIVQAAYLSAERGTAVAVTGSTIGGAQ